MKNFKYIVMSCLAMILVVTGCQDDDSTIGMLTPATNVSVDAEIVGAYEAFPDGDGSGLVIFTVTADDAISYSFQFGDGTTEVSPSGKITHRYGSVGLNSYDVVANAIGTGGIISNTAITIEVFNSFDDPEIKEYLTGGSSRTWYLAAGEENHFGLGPSREGIDGDWWYPKSSWYVAKPFELCDNPGSSCFCDDELTFTLTANNELSFQQDNKGQTFYNGAQSGLGGGDVCLDLDTSGTFAVQLAPSEEAIPEAETTGTVMSFTDGGFMSYYLGASTYEILSITDTNMYVRVLDPLNDVVAWYLKFQTSPAEKEAGFDELVWFDEFDIDGAPDATKWTYDLGDLGFNDEEQTYTKDAENVIVEDGVLKIIAKADGSGGYTSARLKTEGIFSFKYGRIDISAKLPASQGTWPALWMLGDNISTVGWPLCGEIDIMEQTGQDKATMFSTLHWFDTALNGNASYGNIAGGDGPVQVTNATSEFRVYSMEWTEDEIKMYVDDVEHLVISNNADLPFVENFFMVLNIAMGGTLGGTIDPDFTEDSMEIDYIKVYQ